MIREYEKPYAVFEYFASLLSSLQQHAEFPLRSVAPDGHSWLLVASASHGQLSGCQFAYSFARGGRFRVELYIDTGSQERNKQIFDALVEQRSTIESALDVQLAWERLDNRRASRIVWYHDGTITDSANKLARLRDWAGDAMVKFYAVFDEHLSKMA